MKTIAIALFTTLAVITGSASAQQSLTLTTPGVNFTGPANTIQIGHARITNTGGGQLDVKVIRTQKDTAAGHDSFFCWGGACFPTTTNESPFSITMNPGDFDSTLEAKLDPRGNAGTSVVTYCFYDTNNPSDSVCITYTYNFTGVGVEEIPLSKALSVASPNPADNFTIISYQSTTRNGKLVIANLLGNIVREIPLNDKQNTLRISTADLGAGIYLYSLQADGKTIVTRKLIVNH
jgi:hypothetical protein